MFEKLRIFKRLKGIEILLGQLIQVVNNQAQVLEKSGALKKAERVLEKEEKAKGLRKK